MAELPFIKPRLPGYFYIRLEARNAAGEDILVFTSERRKLRLAGHSLSEFMTSVIPLLDGQHTLEEIYRETGTLFSREDLVRSLLLLTEHGLLEEGVEETPPREQFLRLTPQLNFFRELGGGRKIQQQMAEATVTIIGAAGAGAYAALSLAATGIGSLHVSDSHAIAPTDIYLSPIYDAQETGSARAEALSRKVSKIAPEVKFETLTFPLNNDEDVERAVRGSHFVICCVDAGLSSLLYQVNRVCFTKRIRWTTASVSGFEGILGPTVLPQESACYLCYKMRAVACAENPEEEFGFQRFLDQRKRDDSSQRENLVFAGGMMGHLLGLEAMKCITGMFAPAAAGSILTIDFLTMEMTKHVVLKKPWCPVCYEPLSRQGVP